MYFHCPTGLCNPLNSLCVEVENCNFGSFSLKKKKKGKYVNWSEISGFLLWVYCCKSMSTHKALKTNLLMNNFSREFFIHEIRTLDPSWAVFARTVTVVASICILLIFWKMILDLTLENKIRKNNEEKEGYKTTTTTTEVWFCTGGILSGILNTAFL